MDAANVVYVNLQAEGARISPEEINEQNVEFVARFWKNGQTVVHVNMLSMETVRTKEIVKKFLVADLGAAKMYLPLEKAALQPNQDPMTLTNHLVSVVIETIDIKDEGNRVMFVNREKALDTLRKINSKRLKPGQRAYGVVQRIIRGGYVLNVGGELAYLPRAFYDWDFDKLASVGDEFPVMIMPERTARRRPTASAETVVTTPEEKDASSNSETTRQRFMVVSRRELISNPAEAINLKQGAFVDGRIISLLPSGRVLVEVAKGVVVSSIVNARSIRRTPKINDHVRMKILSTNEQIRKSGTLVEILRDRTVNTIAR